MINRLIPYRYRKRLEQKAHDKAIASVLNTAPIVPRDDGLVLFSMIGTAVLLPYLVAVKSLWHQVQRGRVVILDDGSLTPADRETLAFHCGRPEIISIAAVDTGEFPTGGTWERLLTILDRRRDEYWIQLDSDTVTLAPTPEIMGAIDANRSFVLLGGGDAEIGALPVGEIAAQLYPGGPAGGHVQTRIESRLGQIPANNGWRYVRGCSGFTGFSAGGAGRELAAAFLGEMERLIGKEDTFIWGTEQVASNFQLANDPDTVMLPSARYLNYWGEGWPDDAAFVHFVGTHRYDHGAYATASRQVIDEMGQSRAEMGRKAS